jgi:4-amino-4-deoxy-L-arabinose transferase-like glycosyltransferase
MRAIRTGPSRRLLGAAALLSLLLPALSHDLTLPDEARVAHTSFEMGRSEGWLLPAVNGEPFLQTPPLGYWLVSAWLRLAGTHPDQPDGMVRIPSVLFSLATLAVTARLAQRFHGERAAFVAAAILASTVEFWEVGHRAVVEPAMAFFVTLAYYHLAFVVARGDLSLWRGVAVGLAAGAAFLVKGLPALAFLLAAAPLAVFLRRGLPWGRLALLALAALGAFALVAAPWALLHARFHPGTLREVLVDHLFTRAVAGTVKDPTNFTFLHRTLGALAPWVVFLPFAVAAHARSAWGRASRTEGGERAAGTEGADGAERAERAERAAEGPVRAVDERARLSGLLLLWALLPVLLLLVSRSKRNLYLLPVFPAFALLAATWIEPFLERPRWQRGIEWLGRALLAIVPAAVLALAARFAARAEWLAAALAAAVLVVVVLVVVFARAARSRSGAGGGAAGRETGRETGRWTEARPWRVLILCLLAVAAGGTWRHLLLEPERSLGSFGREVAALASGGVVVGYELSEREVGAMAWYLRRPFPVVTGGEERLLGALMEYDPGRTIIIGEAAGFERARQGREVVAEKRLRRRVLQALGPARP